MTRRLIEMTPVALRAVPAESVVLVPIVVSPEHGTALPVGAEGFVTEDLCAELVDARGRDLDLWLAPPVRDGLVHGASRADHGMAHDLLRRTGTRRAIAVQARSCREGDRASRGCERAPRPARRVSGSPTLSWRDLLAEVHGGPLETTVPSPEGDDDLVALLGYLRPQLLAPGTARSAATSPQRGQVLFDEIVRRSVKALTLLQAGELPFTPRTDRGWRPGALRSGIDGRDGGVR